ncbi:MAG: branched-chain amino acid ABC transporter permease [Rhodospirillales bacterium]|nr:branched-chain amino acid ABC transporter permease [Rhodospirillales bacterium]
MIGAVVVDGVLIAAVLSLASLGLSLSYAVFRFPNFAHADLLTIGAFAAWSGATLAGGNAAPMLSLAAGAAAALVTCAGVILLADRLVLRALLARRQSASVIIAAFAIGLLLRNVLVLIFGPGEVALDRDIEIARPVMLLPGLSAGRLTATESGVILATALLLAGLHIFLRHSPTGRDLRAVAEDPDLAGLSGLVVPRIRVLAWGLCGAFCAAAGLAILMLGPAQPETGSEYMLPALAAVVVGGLGSIWGMLAGALLIGLVESVTVHVGLAEWREVTAFALVVLVLFLRPAGLFGRA